jgi:hypothetical protein
MTLFSAADIAELAAIDVSAMNETWTITDRDVSDAGPESETTRTVVGYLTTANGREAGEDQVRAFGAHRLYIPLTAAAVGATAQDTQVSTGRQINVVYPYPVTAYSTSRVIGLEDA